MRTSYSIATVVSIAFAASFIGIGSNTGVAHADRAPIFSTAPFVVPSESSGFAPAHSAVGAHSSRMLRTVANTTPEPPDQVTPVAPSHNAVAAPSEAPSVPGEAPLPPPPAPSPGPVAPAPNTPESLPIGAYDTLHIDVVAQPDLSKDYMVDSAGDIQVEFVGKVELGGLTIGQAETVLTKRLSKIYANVSLTILRTSVGGISVTVTGAVVKVGPVSVRRDAHLNDLIQALSPQPEADLTKVQVSRTSPEGDRSTSYIDLTTYTNTGNPAGNPLLKDGDIIYVPNHSKPAPMTISVSISGTVPRPGKFEITVGSTLFDLISEAGGLSSSADPKAIYIQPADQGPRQLVDWTELSQHPDNIKLNPVLQDGDKVVVPELASVAIFSIMGAVRAPNTYPIRGNVSLLDAYAMAGGLADRAQTSDTHIVRVTPNGVTTINVDGANPSVAALFVVQPNDHIEVPQGKNRPGINPLEIIPVVVSLWLLFK